MLGFDSIFSRMCFHSLGAEVEYLQEVFLLASTTPNTTLGPIYVGF